MPVRMTHTKHGVTFAVGAEVAWNQSNGWKIAPSAPPDIPPVAADVIESVEPDSTIAEPEHDPLAGFTLEERYELKFGKAPHHRMKPESIEAALKE